MATCTSARGQQHACACFVLGTIFFFLSIHQARLLDATTFLDEAIATRDAKKLRGLLAPDIVIHRGGEPCASAAKTLKKLQPASPGVCVMDNKCSA